MQGREVKNKQLTNKELKPLTDRQVTKIESIYKQVWEDRGSIGSAKTWFDVIVSYLISEGYAITDKKTPDNVK